MIIKIADTNEEREQLDQVLWEVLWAPLALSRDIRQTFALDNDPVEFIAVENGDIVGGLVANRIDENALEIRHIALAPNHQQRSIGSGMVNALVEFARKEGIDKIQAYARNTSLGFFMHNGFATGDKMTHPDFARHEITFQKVVLNLEAP